jgi:hypothetical protein
MSDEITFLPWVRRGLAQAVENADPLNGGLPRGGTLNAYVDIEDRHVPKTLLMRGPEAVAGLSTAQVLRSEPRPDSTDVELNYFPLVELAAPDLPWMFTPARAEDKQGKLRPWLVLVAVREQEGVSIETRSGTSLPVLRIESPAVPAGELPDLAESWAWAHVHSLVEPAAIEGAVTGRTGQVYARLLCPRRLLPDSAWLTCLVPAFDSGVARGLGRPQPDGDELLPAWDYDALGDTIELPVYHHWRFTTGAAGDFEALCRRLKADGDAAEMGLYPMDVTDPGLVRAAAKPVFLDMAGALRTLEAEPRAWNKNHKKDFQEDIRELIKPGARDYDPAIDDPVVAPPQYGAWPAEETDPPKTEWVPELNEDPVHRAAAGLGARAVRAAQEELVAAAWEQAGDLKPTIAALNRGRLAAEIGRSWTARAVALEDEDLLQLTGSMHAFLSDGSTSVRAQLASSDVPGGLVSAAYMRQTRAGTPLARDWAARTGSTSARLGADHTRINVAATGDPDKETALRFAQFGPPAGAQLTDPVLFEQANATAFKRDPARRAELERLLEHPLEDRPEDIPLPREDPIPPVLTGADVSGIAGTVRETLDPLGSVRAGVLLRVQALEGLLPAEGLPSSIPVGPVFNDSLYWDLLGLGASWVLPGIETMKPNRVRLVETDPEFVGSFMVGANNELGCELLWRGYPVDLRATFFRRFWNYVDTGRMDIDALYDWDDDKTIAENMGMEDTDDPTMTVVVVRGDIVRRYPTAHFFLQQAAYVKPEERESIDGTEGEVEPVEGTETEPDFLGSLGPDTVFFGFSQLDSDVVRGNRPDPDAPGYFFVIEEQAGAPRFGLDEAKPAHFEPDSEPKTWNGASWGHLVESQEALDALTHARADDGRLVALELHGTTWGYNAAHMARACWQRPFRMLIHADLLV